MRFIRSFKLEELCLQVIIKNLKMFICGQFQCKSQRHVDFLLRLYAKKCFHEFSSANPKTEEFLLWFLNPYNKTVVLPFVTENIINKLQFVGPALTSVTLYESMATENILNSIICCIPNVIYLDLKHTLCSDKTLLCIQRMCPDLVSLNVQDCYYVTDDGMLNLCGNNLSLQNLNILDTSVEYGGLRDILKGMPSLQCLKYDNMADRLHSIHEFELCTSDCGNIKYNLTELIYEDIGFCDNPLKVIWTWTVLCPSVKKVHILFPVRNEVLGLCSKFQNLEELKIKGKNEFVWFENEFELPEKEFEWFENEFEWFKSKYQWSSNESNSLDVLTPFLPIASNLTTLLLSYVEFSPVTLVECFKNIKNLYLHKVHFKNFSIEEVRSKFNLNLDTLIINNLNLDTDSPTLEFIILLVSLSKNVTRLSVQHVNNLSKLFLETALQSMKNLAFLGFSFGTLPSSISEFFEIPSLKRLYLDACSCPFSKLPSAEPSSSTLSWRIMLTNCDDSDSEVSEDDL